MRTRHSRLRCSVTPSASGPDDFSQPHGLFGKASPVALARGRCLTCLGIEYYNTAYYSARWAAWQEAWALGQQATDAKGEFLADRAVCELAGLYCRLGRMTELESLLKSIEKRVFIGGATERINLAWEALFDDAESARDFLPLRADGVAIHSQVGSETPYVVSYKCVDGDFQFASTQKGFSCRKWPNSRRRSG